MPDVCFDCSSSVPVRVEQEGGTADLFAGTLAEPSVQGHGLPPPQELCPYQSLFSKASCSWQSEGLFGQSFSVALPVQALRGLPCLGSFSVVRHIRHIQVAPLAGVLLCRSVHQAFKGTPWIGSCSVVQCVRHLMGQPLYCSAANAGVWGERGYGDGSTHYA